MKTKDLYAIIVSVSLLLAGIQPVHAIGIPDDPPSVGTWDPVNKIYTLTQNVNETIVSIVPE